MKEHNRDVTLVRLVCVCVCVCLSKYVLYVKSFVHQKHSFGNLADSSEKDIHAFPFSV